MARRKKLKGRDRHHLIPRSRGGGGLPNNLLLIHVERHFYWHKVFGNLTLDEVISLLQRVKRAKNLNKEGK